MIALMGPQAWLQQKLAIPWQQRRNRRQRAWTWLFVAFVLGAAALLEWLLGPKLRGGATVGGFGLLLLVVWADQFHTLLVQNHPTHARLVPRHTERLRQSALVLGAACVLLFGAAFGLLFGHAPLAMLAFATVLLALALCLRWWVMWILLWLVPTLIDVWGWKPTLWQLALDSWPLLQAHPWQALALGLVLIGLGVSQLFGEGGGTHAERYARFDRFVRMSRMEVDPQAGIGRAPVSKVGAWLMQAADMVSGAWLARLVRRSRNTPRSVMARLNLALHGGQHWLRQFVTSAALLLVVALGLVTLHVMLGREFDPTRWGAGLNGLAGGIVLAAVGSALALGPALWHSRREQALLLLLPGVPRGTALNRALAALQMRQFLLSLGLATALLTALMAAAGRWQYFGPAVAALPCGLWLWWRDPSRIRAVGPTTAVWPMLLALLPGLGLIYLAREASPLFMPLALLILVATVLLAAWRWRVLSRRACALPAGRWG